MAGAEAKLDRIVREIRSCRQCVERPDGPALAHAPRPVLRVTASARIVVAGQAPGTRVHQSGVPFTDPSGDRLREWMGVTLAEFYDASRIAIIPMGFCFPGLDANGGDLPPRRECAPLWRDRLFAALPAARLVLAVGQYAHWWHIGGPRRSVTETIRSFAQGDEPSDGRLSVIPLPHPSWRNNAWLRANPWFSSDVLPRVRREVRRLLD